jgi:hypothetical protein
MPRKKSTSKKTKKSKNVHKKVKHTIVSDEIVPLTADEKRKIVLSSIRKNNKDNTGIEWARRKLKLSSDLSKRDVIKIACEKGFD